MGPKELILYPNNTCNHKCVFCKRQLEGVNLEDLHMKVDLIEDALLKYPSINSVGIAGFGEPLMWEHLEESLSFLLSQPLNFISVITNGSLLHTYLNQQSKLKLINQLSISLNATDAQSHEKITQVDNFNQIVNNINLATKIVSGEVGISFVVTTENYHEIPTLISLASRLGVDFIDFHNLLPHSNIQKQSNKEDFLSLCLTKHNYKILNFLERFKPHPLVRSWPTPISTNSCPFNCNSPFVSLGIDANGNISGCRRVMEPSSEFGNIYDRGWQSQHIQELRNVMKEGDSQDYPCRYCFGNWSG